MNRRKHPRRGSALLTAIFLMVSLALLGYAYIVHMGGELRAAQRSAFLNQAQLVADAGVHAACAKIELDLSGGNGTTVQTVSSTAGTLPGEWSYSVNITPDAQTLAGNTKRIIAVQSMSRFGSGAGVRNITVVNAIVTNDSFAKWVWFQDIRPSNLSLPLDSWTFDGPLHFNSPIRTQNTGSAFWGAGHTHVPFLSQVSSAKRIETEDSVPAWASSKGDGIKYNSMGSQDDVPYNTTTGTPMTAHGTTDRYEKIFEGGRDAFSIVGNVTMPDNFNKLRDGSWGNTTGHPTTAGAYVNADAGGVPKGGIFVNGDVKLCELHTQSYNQRTATNTNVVNSSLSVDPITGLAVLPLSDPGNPGVRFRVQEGSATYEYNFTDVTEPTPVVVNSTNAAGLSGAGFSVAQGQSYLMKRKVNGDGTVSQANVTVQRFNGLSNGAMFSTGDIDRLWGKNKGRRTVGADLENRKTVTIVDDIIRDDTSKYPGGGSINFEADIPSAANETQFKPTGTRDVIGVIGYEVHLASQSALRSGESRSSTSTPLYIYATLYAGHQKIVGNTNWDQDSELGGFMEDGTGGRLHLYGGMQVGFKNATSYELNLHYDPLLAANPPPYYPSVDKVNIITWKTTTLGY